MPVVWRGLIWQESSFRPGVSSGAGAQGVAQFMPGTAAERGLANPFDPEQAIPKSAELLADLRQRFGNLGLAAAAYNGGPARVEAWLAGADRSRVKRATMSLPLPAAWRTTGRTRRAAPSRRSLRRKRRRRDAWFWWRRSGAAQTVA